MKINRFLATISAIALISGMMAPAYADTILYAVDKDSDVLRVLDRTDASTVSSITMTLAGEDIDGAQGLAIDPTTGTLWVILKTGNGDCNRELATLNPSTGVATSIGFMDDCYAGLEFDAAGTLYGVIGDGGAASETLNTLSKTDASTTFVCSLGNGGDGETIVNAAGTWYHWSGHTPGDSDGYIMETFDVSDCSTTDIPRNSGDGWEEEVIAGAYCSEFDQIIVAEEHSSPSNILDVSPTGIPTLIGVIDDSVEDFTVAGLACTGDELVGGEFLPIDSTALLMAGMSANLSLIVPIAAGIAGVGAFYIRSRMN